MENDSELYRVVLLTYEEVSEKYSPLPVESHRQQRERIEHAFFRARSNKRYLNGMRDAVRGVRESIRSLPADDAQHFLKLVRERTGISFFEISGEIEVEVRKIISRKKLLGPCETRLLIDYVSDHPQGAYVNQAAQLLSRNASSE